MPAGYRWDDGWSRPRRSRGGLIWLIVIVLVLAGLWSGLWYYGAATAETMIAGWRERLARLGRIQSCATQAVGGFPFRLEVRCVEPSLELRPPQPQRLTMKAQDAVAVVHVFAPTQMSADFTGPLVVTEPGSPATIVANWTDATATVGGLPFGADRVMLTADGPTVERKTATAAEPLFKASRIEAQGSVTAGAAGSRPIDLALRLNSASEPTLHKITMQPTDAEITGVLRGLNDFSPKPLRALLKQIQAAGGSLEITKARVQQGDIIAVGSGTLSLTARGALDGQLQLTIVGVEKLLAALDLERVAQQSPSMSRLSTALDKLAPGLGSLARENAGVGAAVGINLLGRPAELGGKKAVTLPLRFTDGIAFLGPVQIGQTPPLY
jgi:hypothetical protein